MARTVVALTSGDWTQLGVAGELVLTIHKSGTSGMLLLNSVEDDDNNALRIATQRGGDQFSQTSATDDTWAKATAAGWEIAVDQ